MIDPRLAAYDYHLPLEQIAIYPLAERSASRLLHLNDHLIEDRRVSQLPLLLRKGDLLVFNDTKVLNARVMGHRKSGGKIEIFFLRQEVNSEGYFPVLIKPSKRLKEGETIYIPIPDGKASMIVERYIGEGEWWATILEDVPKLLDLVGRIPIPPYLNREAEALDKDRYQTIFAGPKGAVAAPTAGLHISSSLLQQLNESGVFTESITLHVGIGTFRNLRSEDLEKGRLHSEWFHIRKETADKIKRVKNSGGRVIAVGTTVTRCLEGVFSTKGDICALMGYTDIFIQEGFSFKVIDGLLTNFHLPRTSLLMLVSAFAGRKRVLDAYEHAVSSGYRFFSYGDAMLIL